MQTKMTTLKPHKSYFFFFWPIVDLKSINRMRFKQSNKSTAGNTVQHGSCKLGYNIMCRQYNNTFKKSWLLFFSCSLAESWSFLQDKWSKQLRLPMFFFGFQCCIAQHVTSCCTPRGCLDVGCSYSHIVRCPPWLSNNVRIFTRLYLFSASLQWSSLNLPHSAAQDAPPTEMSAISLQKQPTKSVCIFSLKVSKTHNK